MAIDNAFFNETLNEKNQQLEKIKSEYEQAMQSNEKLSAKLQNSNLHN
jgi:hypothetical protein